MLRLLGELWVVGGEGQTHPWDGTAYLIKGDEPTLIDCGSTLGYPALRANLQSFGYQPRDIVRVLATHGHWDHVSGMSALRQESDAELYLHPGDRLAVETGESDGTAAFLYGQPFPPVQVDHLLADGQVLDVNGLQLTVYHTPGHSPGSVCYWTETGGLKLLIAGDTLWGGYHPKIHSDLDIWVHSLDRLLELDFDVVASGHYPSALIFDARRKVREAKEHFGDLFDPWFRLAKTG